MKNKKKNTFKFLNNSNNTKIEFGFSSPNSIIFDEFSNKSDEIKPDYILNKAIIPDENIKNHKKNPKLSKDLIKSIEILKIKNGTILMTFLIDKWNGMASNKELRSTGNIYFHKFYENFNLPIGLMEGHKTRRKYRYLNLFTGQFLSSDSLYIVRMPHYWGCQNGLDERITCNGLNCPRYLKTKKKCYLRKNNIWVQNSKGAPFRLSKNYLSVIKSEILVGKKIDFTALGENLYKNFDSKLKFGVKFEKKNLIEKFLSDFHFSQKEFQFLFKIN
jgi:hypothetical protein